MTEVVEILLKLRGTHAFETAAKHAGKSVKGVGDDAETAGKKAARGWKGVAKWAGGAAAFAGAAHFLHSSVSATEELAKSTMGLQRSTGLDAETASAWATVTKSRGIETKRFQMSLVKLSQSMDGAKHGSKTMAETLSRMGISDATIQTGDMQQALLDAADSYATMKNPAAKAALAQKLFGRSALQLAPLLAGGSDGIKEQMGLAQKYGATLSDDAVGGSKEMIAKQREMKIAMEGLKVQLGEALMPAIESVVEVLAKVTSTMQPLLRNSTLVKLALGAMVLSFVTLKVATIAATVAALPFNAAFLLIPLALAAVVVGLVLAYKKFGWFRAGVQAVIGFVRDHWPLILSILTGPIGAAVIYIVRHWDSVVGFFRKLPSRITSAASGMWNGIKDAFKAAINWIIGGWNSLDFKVPSIDMGPLGHVGGFHIGVPDIPLLAAGGHVMGAGHAIVGDRGPELVRLPRGASVFPAANVAPLGDSGRLLDPEPPQIIQLVVDGRVLSEVVARRTADLRARR